MRRIVILLVSCFVCHHFFITTNAQMNFTFGDVTCVDDGFNYTRGSSQETSLKSVISHLTTESSSSWFHSEYISDKSLNTVYGFFQCRYDLSLEDCSRCVNQTISYLLEDCLFFGEAVVWYEECTVGYGNRDLVSHAKISPVFRKSIGTNVSNIAEFRTILNNTLGELCDNASSLWPHYALSTTKPKNVEQLYSYVQCSGRWAKFLCDECLTTALSELIECCSQSEGAMIFMPLCHLRYDTTKPFLTSTDLPSQGPMGGRSPSPPPSEMPVPPPPQIDDIPTQKSPTSVKKGPKTAIIVAIAAPAGVVLLVLIIICWICLFRKKPKETTSSGRVIPQSSPRGLQDSAKNLRDRDFVQYDFAILRTATGNFSDGNRLGQGGFGTVYKGTLESGELLAIKRLSGTSGQGSNEFKTEARLLAKLQHKNLVKLMGFCSEGDEKLLVYEFMSNASLDSFLFDPRRQPLLDWVTRYKIITGIARGLQYLHEDSRLTIIHRDLKPGNILLDNDMNPKVADFGLAKLFQIAQSFGNTSRIAGTLGYMAPEYMTSGEYSDKSDVYSYGIMLLEIVSGINNINFFQTQKEDLPVHAWRLWNEDQSLNLTDPVLLSNFESNDVMRCIQIGLLCLQANPSERPTMTFVVIMLTCNVDVPLPSAPAMSFPQFNMPVTYSSTQQRGRDLTTSGGTTTYSGTQQSGRNSTKPGGTMTYIGTQQSGRNSTKSGDTMTYSGTHQSGRNSTKSGDTMTYSGTQQSGQNLTKSGGIMTYSGTQQSGRNSTKSGDTMTYSGTQQSGSTKSGDTMTYSGTQQSGRNSTKFGDTMRSISDQDLYPQPR